MKPISCLFWYQMRARRLNPATKKMEPLLDSNDKPVLNDNYISFLQVISAFWEQVEQNDGSFKLMLNVFLNGGSISIDPNTGERRSKMGYTVIFNEMMGTKFITAWWNWSEKFGLASPTAPQYRNTREHGDSEAPRRVGRSQARQIHDDDFVDPDAPNIEPIAVIE